MTLLLSGGPLPALDASQTLAASATPGAAVITASNVTVTATAAGQSVTLPDAVQGVGGLNPFTGPTGCEKRKVRVTNASSYPFAMLPAGADLAPVLNVVPPFSTVVLTCVSGGRGWGKLFHEFRSGRVLLPAPQTPLAGGADKPAMTALLRCPWAPSTVAAPSQITSGRVIMESIETNVTRVADSLFAVIPPGPDRRANMLKAFDLAVPRLTKVAFASTPLPFAQRRAFAQTAEDLCRVAFIKRLDQLEKGQGR